MQQERRWPWHHHGPDHAQGRASTLPPAGGNERARLEHSERRRVGGWGGGQGRGHGTGAVPKETVRKRRNYKARIPAPGWNIRFTTNALAENATLAGVRSRKHWMEQPKKSKQGEEKSVMKQIPGVISMGGEGKNFNYGATALSLPQHTSSPATLCGTWNS